MEVTISGTQVTVVGSNVLGFALDNLYNTFTATTDLPEEWSYTLSVHMILRDVYNVIQLSRSGQTLSVDLTMDMLPYNGRYEMQFVATNGDIVMHTDIFDAQVNYTIDPTDYYTPVPSEFYQIQKNIEDLNSHPPYPGNQGYWMIWNVNTGQYEQSTLPVGDGGADKTYVFSQNVPATTWYVQHNLNKYPSVSIVDSGNNMVIGNVTYIDTNNLTIDFSAAFSGQAYMN